MSDIQEIIDFWFGTPGSEGYGENRKAWFTKDPDFDAEIRNRFGALVERAMAGGLEDWAETAEGALALLILLDQFTRNLHRGQAKAFEADARARAIARKMVDAGFDQELLPVQRVFAYLPFEHSEDMADQDRSMALFTALGFGDTLKWAEAHRDIVARFGRFPHRNAVLGRESTDEEVAFLKEPGSSF